MCISLDCLPIVVIYFDVFFINKLSTFICNDTFDLLSIFILFNCNTYSYIYCFFLSPENSVKF